MPVPAVAVDGLGSVSFCGVAGPSSVVFVAIGVVDAPEVTVGPPFLVGSTGETVSGLMFSFVTSDMAGADAGALRPSTSEEDLRGSLLAKAVDERPLAAVDDSAFGSKGTCPAKIAVVLVGAAD